MSLVCVIHVSPWILVFTDSISAHVMAPWVCGVFDEEQEAKEDAVNMYVGRHGDNDVLDSSQDLYEARNHSLLPKRRKVKSTRYAVRTPHV